MKKCLRIRDVIIFLLITLVSCDNNSSPSQTIANLTSDPIITENDSDTSVFITNLDVSIDQELLSAISFSISPMANSISEAISARYGIDKLEIVGGIIKLPIFGLYNNYRNSIDITLTFTDSSTKNMSYVVDAAEYIDPNNIYDDISILSSVNIENKPTYNYIFIEGNTSGPVILDIDGNIRWVGNEDINSRSSYFENNSFKIAIDGRLMTLSLDGSQSETTVSQEGLSNISFHHELSKGKFGYLAHINADKNGGPQVETIILELSPNGETLKEWDFGEIFSEYMINNGDDPSNFVRDGIDWFHSNSAIYDPSDDSLIVSSRENFVVKIDYDTNEILWLLGDESKFWYTYPSLSALSLFSNDIKPMGQHGLSLVEGELSLFNNGQLSWNNPGGTSSGQKLSSSIASRYQIDLESRTAELTWNYDPGLYSPFCSSVYRDQSIVNGDYLVTYSVISIGPLRPHEPVTTLLHGVNEEKELLFAFQFNTIPCNVWNADPIHSLSNIIF